MGMVATGVVVSDSRFSRFGGIVLAGGEYAEQPRERRGCEDDIFHKILSIKNLEKERTRQHKHKVVIGAASMPH
jgi:hypothetical protein